MLTRKYAAASCLALVLALIHLLPRPAAADDNTTGEHWHDLTFPWFSISTSFPEDWVIPVLDSSEEWDGDTLFSPEYNGRINSTDWTNLNSHIVWRGAIPSAFQSGCPPETTLACTSWRVYTDGHIADADIVFNQDREMGNSDFACSVFGPLTTDVRSVALHELGHFGGLGHTSDGDAVMYFSYVDCRRQLHAHDIQSMNNNYPGH